MTINKKWLYSLLFFVIAILVLMFLFFGQFTNNNQVFSDNEKIELSFAENFMSYIISDDTMSFNLFGVQNVNSFDPSISEVITDIKFNNPNIEIVDYNIDTGIVHKGYKLLNIIIEVKVLTDEVETADQFTVFLKNGSEEVYEIGKVTLQNDRNFNQEHFEPSGNYNVGYPSLSLNATLRNKTNNNVSLLNLFDLTGNISYEFPDSYEITSNEVKQILIDDFDTEDEVNYDFLTITPILKYQIENKQFLYNMPGVIYGVLDSDIDKIEKMIR